MRSAWAWGMALGLGCGPAEPRGGSSGSDTGGDSTSGDGASHSDGVGVVDSSSDSGAATSSSSGEGAEGSSSGALDCDPPRGEGSGNRGIDVTLRNDTAAPLYLPTCANGSLFQTSGFVLDDPRIPCADYREYTCAIIEGCMEPPLHLAPGASRSFHVLPQIHEHYALDGCFECEDDDPFPLPTLDDCAVTHPPPRGRHPVTAIVFSAIACYDGSPSEACDCAPGVDGTCEVEDGWLRGEPIEQAGTLDLDTFAPVEIAIQ
jgi:hypothetical protein